MVTCPGALVVHADNTVMGCTEDDERDASADSRLPTSR
jgi:hypothetical protein